MNKLIVSLGTLALLGSVIGGALMAQRTPVSHTASQEEPDHFSFIRPVDAAAETQRASEVQQSPSIPDFQLRSLFDRRLTLDSHRPVAEVWKELEQELKQRLPPQAREQALAFLGRYVQYKQASAPLQLAIDSTGNAENLRRYIEELQDLRARLFSESEITAWFQADSANEKLMVARLQIQQDPALTEEQKHLQLQELEASIPAEVHAAEESRSNIVRLDSAPVMQTSDEGDEDIYKLVPTEVSR